jgi:restriction endonuclease S subunit
MSDPHHDWDEMPLGDIADVINGRAYKLSEWEESGTPVIRLQNLTQRGGNFYYSNLRLPESQYCHKGDLLYMWSATFGPHIWWGDKAIYHYHIWKIEPKEQIYKTFLFYLLDAKTQEWKAAGSGMAMVHLTKAGIEKEMLPVPPLPEQKKIAEILSGIDRAIARERSMLLKIDHAIQAVRDKTQSCHGEERKIGNLISKISTGVSVSGENRPCRPSEQGVLKVSCVSKGEFLPSENKVIDDENKGRVTMSIKKGMLLVSRANTPELVGACGITRKDYDNLFLPDKIWNLEIQESSGCSKKWLNNALNSQVAKTRIRDASTGTSDSMRNISQSNFCEIDILVPPLDIQQQQSDLIDSLLRRKQIIATKLEIHLLLKAALSADLLSGRKRVSI